MTFPRLAAGVVLVALASAGIVSGPTRLPAQAPSLAELHRQAASRDPRARQAALYRAQSALREASIRADMQPALSVEGLAQYQSDVPSLPLSLPGGGSAPGPAHDSYDARLGARQRLLDPTLQPRLAVERAQLAEAEARVATSLFQVRQAVNEAYFTALLLQSQEGEVAQVVRDLEAQLAMARERVAAGSALPSEANTLEAELLRRRQSVTELAAGRAAALDVLRELTGTVLGASDTLSMPAPGAVVPTSRAARDSLRVRPEFAQFARARDALAAQQELAGARERPRVSAFGRFGYGRPGLNVLGDRFDTYWLAGVQLEWTPWTWGTTRRDREVLALQREIVASEEDAFRDLLERTVIRDASAIERLEETLAGDEQIIALRQQILAETRLRYGEGVVTAAEYVDRQTDLVNARLARATHRAELAQAQARLLTTLGLEIP